MADSQLAQTRKILETIDSEEADFRTIGLAVMECEELRDEVMRQANSVSLAAKHKVDDIRHAIAVLGQNRLRRITENYLIRIDSQQSVVPPAHFPASQANQVDSPSG